jgi:hypothetical protein
MEKRNWLDRQLKEARLAVESWSERKRAVLKAQMVNRGRTSLSRTAGEERSSEPDQKRIAAKR